MLIVYVRFAISYLMTLLYQAVHAHVCMPCCSCLSKKPKKHATKLLDYRMTSAALWFYCTLYTNTCCRNSEAKLCPGDDYGPGRLPGLCVARIYLMEEHDHKCFKSLLRSLRIAYDFSDALKTHLNVCRVCCPLNDQIQ